MYQDVPYALYESAFKTGSSVICNPPVTNTDEDVMFFTEDYSGLVVHLLINGWEACNSKEYEGQDGDYNWSAYRKGNLNYLITDNQDYYDKFELATNLATKLNLLEKSQRITLFTYIIKGTI